MAYGQSNILGCIRYCDEALIQNVCYFLLVPRPVICLISCFYESILTAGIESPCSGVSCWAWAWTAEHWCNSYPHRRGPLEQV